MVNKLLKPAKCPIVKKLPKLKKTNHLAVDSKAKGTRKAFIKVIEGLWENPDLTKDMESFLEEAVTQDDKDNTTATCGGDDEKPVLGNVADTTLSKLIQKHSQLSALQLGSMGPSRLASIGDKDFADADGKIRWGDIGALAVVISTLTKKKGERVIHRPTNTSVGIKATTGITSKHECVSNWNDMQSRAEAMNGAHQVKLAKLFRKGSGPEKYKQLTGESKPWANDLKMAVKKYEQRKAKIEQDLKAKKDEDDLFKTPSKKGKSLTEEGLKKMEAQRKTLREKRTSKVSAHRIA